MKRRLIKLLFIIFLSFTGCVEEKGQITIGWIGPLTGTSSTFGQMGLIGAQLAVDEINAGGGINGNIINFVFYNDGGNVRQAKTEAVRLFESNPDISAIVGHSNSSCTLAGARIYNQRGVVALTPISTNVKISEAGPWIFRLCINDKTQGHKLGYYAVEKLKAKKIAVFYEDDSYGRGLKDFFVKAISERGSEVVAEIDYASDAAKFNPAMLLSSIVGKDVDLVFIAGYYMQAAGLCKVIRDKGMKMPILGGDGLNSTELIRVGGEVVEGIRYPVLFRPDLDDEKIKAFSKKFEKTYHMFPSDDAAYAYEAVKLLAYSIKHAGRKPQAIRDYLRSIGVEHPVYEGITGRTAFDENGDAKDKPLYMVTVKNGKIAWDELQF